MPHPGSITASQGQPPDEERAGTAEGRLLPIPGLGRSGERPVLPAGGLRRTSRLAALPLRHAARTAAAATRLSRLASDQVAARTAEQLFGTLGELKGGAAKLGQAMSVFEAAMPEEIAAPYRSALRRLTDAAPPMPVETAHRVIAADLGAAFGAGWQDRLIAFDDTPRAAVTVPAVYAATPRVLITRWLDGASLSRLLDGRMDLLPEGWRELSPGDAADLAARLLGHAIYAPAACTGWMHADLHPGNFLLLPGGRLGMLDFGAVAAVPGGIPVPFGQLAAAVLAGDSPPRCGI
jgi:predicted unusual protein kinase regulating ubiquinone biosynthesis (AarF/ABC1/UbiB family)